MNLFTAHSAIYPFNAPPVALESMMTKKIDLLTASVALGVASYAAIILDCLAHDQFGLSDRQICRSAVAAAFLIALVLGAASFSKEAGKAKSSDPRR